jgi:hypothetical protein
VVDSTGQVHQFKARLQGSGDWETVTIPFTRKLEHWKGANDGVVHFPLAEFMVNVPLPNEHAVTGELEITNLKVVE